MSVSSSNNAVLVTGSNSIWSNRSSLIVGNTGLGNTLTITNGGAVFNDYSFVGYYSYSSNNAVQVTGSGSVWQNRGTLYLGYGGSSNLLTIAGGSVMASNAFVGFSLVGFGIASNNVLRIESGSLFVTNAVHHGDLVVSARGGRGDLVVNGGSVSVDSLIATNGANSVIAFNGGTLNSGGTYVTNNQMFVVGNGSNAAVFHLAGGIHSFANNLEIHNNAFLTGCGTITDNVVVDSGGTVLADCGGALNFSGTVTNNGTVVAVNGTYINFYGPVVNNGLIDATNGGVQFFSSLVNNGTILTTNGLPGIVNSWTNDVGGLWFTATNWSLGAIPTNTHSVLITNGLTKTVVFMGNHGPQTISHLLVSAPVGDTNTLMLSLGGPGGLALTVLDSLTVNEGGLLQTSTNVSTNHQFIVSGLSGGAFTIDGQSILGGITIATNVPTYVGYLGNGTMRINGTRFSGRDAYVGFNPGSSGELTIAGGTNTLSANLVVGHLAAATGSVWVTGGQLAVTNDAAYVGSNGVGQITVSNGTMLARDLFVGMSSGSQGALTVAGGSLVVANAGNTGLTDVRRGSMTINGGAVTVDQLFVTNGPAAGFGLNGGTLNTKSTTVSNGSVVDVGDGASAATLHLIGGLHSFANNLRIRTNASLTGCGTITGNVAVEGTVLADCGSTLNFSGTVTNNGTVVASGGTVLNFYGPVVNNSLIDNTSGNIQFFSGISGSGLMITPTNSWTDGSGKWETAANWSQSLSPSSSDAANVITNAGNNIVTVDSTTAGSFPGTMTIRNLTIAGIGGSTNTLALSGAGLATPFHVLNAVNLSNQSAVVVNNSAAQVDVGLAVGAPFGSDNQLIITNGSQLVSTTAIIGGLSGFNNTALVTGTNSLWFSGGTIQVGNGGSAESLTVADDGALIVTNAGHTAQVKVDGATLFLGVGTFQTDNLVVTNGGAVQYAQTYQVENATVTIASGAVEARSNLVVASAAGSTSSVAVAGGSLVATNGTTTIGNNGVGSLTVSNGSVSTGQTDLGAGTNSSGALTLLTGGTMTVLSNLTLASAFGSSGTVAVAGGTLAVTNGVVGVGNSGTITGGNGFGSVTVSNGTLLVSSILLGSSVGGHGHLSIQSGGLVDFENCTGPDCSLSANQLTIEGGKLCMTNMTPLYAGRGKAGEMILFDGLAYCLNVCIGWDDLGTLTVLNGSMTVPVWLSIGERGPPLNPSTTSTGLVWVLGGELVVTNSNPNIITYIGNGGVGQLTLSNGTLRASSLRVANGSNPGTLTIAGGTLITDYLAMPKTNSYCAFLNGQLIVGQIITNANGRTFTVGGGSGPALLTLGSGFHVFSNGLTIAGNGTLTSCGGTISGSVLNNGLVQTGCSGAPLVFADAVINNGMMIAANGGLFKFLGPVVNNGVMDITSGGVLLLGGVSGTGTMFMPPLSIRRTGNDMVISIQSAIGNTYQLQSRDTLGAGGWTDVSGVSREGTGGVLALTDPGGATNVPGRFYRVRIGP